MIKRLFGTFAAKVTVVALAGGFATGGLVAAGAFTGGAAPRETAPTLESSSNTGAAQAKIAVEATSTPTVADPEDHNATSTVKAGPDGDHGLPTATATPKPTQPASKVEDNDADEGVTNTVEADDADDSATPNHGNCVAYAASIVHALGLTGEQNGAFISLVARDKTAVTAKVAAGGTPDAACATAIVTAKVAAQAAGVTTTADDHGDNHDSGNHDTTQHHGNDDKTASTTSATSGENKGSHH
ncbi:MAG: hypothetical protein JWM17_592 [Actinobacteria bacterium]|nr:hypothetical protein [Actinomycetota bacterium]